jgi:serine/threonine protein kinase
MGASRRIVLVKVRCPNLAAADPQHGAKLPLRVGRFQVRAVVGSGAFGTVYRAFDPELERDVALKVPHACVLHNSQRLGQVEAPAHRAGVRNRL